MKNKERNREIEEIEKQKKTHESRLDAIHYLPNLGQRYLRTLGVAVLLFMPSEAFDPAISNRTHLAGFFLGVLLPHLLITKIFVAEILKN